MKKKIAAAALALISTVSLLGGCSGSEASNYGLSPDSPVVVTLWHYYNGAQKTSFDEAVTEFNDTVGREMGIMVEAYNNGNVNTLEENIMAAVNGDVGSSELPNIFASYADTAYSIVQKGLIADLDKYLTEEEQQEYVTSYIEEGRIGENDALHIFPTAKSTEVVMINKTDWEPFASETGASLDELSTYEGITKTAEAYYNWTDAKTPDVPNDGKAFYGRDAFANYMIIGSMQLGTEIFAVENGKVTVNADKETMRKLWDNYYVPYVKGYFGAYGRFRSDDTKIGKILASSCSTSSVSYFPTEVTVDDKSYPIEAVIMSNPVFENGKKIQVQQGAGMAVSKTTEKEEYASVVFLRWFTDRERNLEFGCSSGYLPVKKDAYELTALDETFAKSENVSEFFKTTLNICFNETDTTRYTIKAFENSSSARKVLEYNMPDCAAADRAEVETRLAEGMSLEEATADFVSDENFENWYTQFTEKLNSETFK